MEIQDKFNKENHIYKITDDIDLNGGTLNIPYNSVLDFQGGTIKNGTIVLDKNKILPNGCDITEYITATIEGTYHMGQCLFDSSIYKPKWWNGSYWVYSDGISTNILKSGTFAQKPVNTQQIPIGFAYYCTDKQTIEGSRNGIMIYYAGDNTWVDALGRVVS